MAYCEVIAESVADVVGDKIVRKFGRFGVDGGCSVLRENDFRFSLTGLDDSIFEYKSELLFDDLFEYPSIHLHIKSRYLLFHLAPCQFN